MTAWTPRVAALRQRQQAERGDLSRKESTVFRRVAIMLDFTGTMKKRRDASRKALSRIHQGERADFARSYKEAGKIQQAAVTGRCAAARQDIVQARDHALSGLLERHREAEQNADKRLQAREADRSTSRGFMEATLRTWQRTKDRSASPSVANDRGGGRGGPSPS